MKKYACLKTMIKIAVPVVILIVILLIKFAPGGKDDLSLAKYITVKVTGLNKDATAVGSVDQVGLLAAISNDETTDAQKKLYEAFIATITFTLSEQDKLSNGDSIDIKVKYDAAAAKKANVKIAATSREMKISGLENGDELDAFKNLKIVTSGISPYITVTYTNDSKNSYLKTLEYTIDKTNNISIGDTIKITCKADKATAAKNGYYLKDTVMKYTISEADQYITKPEQMDKAVIEGLSKDDIATIQSETADTTFHMTYKLTHDNSYLFLDNNEEAKGFAQYKSVLAYNTTGFEHKHENYILVFYKGTIAYPTYKDDEPYKYIDAYFCFVYNDAILKTNKTISMAVNDPKYRYLCSDSYKNALSMAKEEIGAGYEYKDITGSDK